MPITVGQDTAKTRKTITINGKSLAYYSIPAAQAAGLGDFSKIPAALKVVLENMLRFEDGKTVSVEDIKAFGVWAEQGGQNPREIAYRPARVLMQDFTGVPAVVDLAAMRDGIVALGGDAQKINPLNPVDLVIDHSVMIDEFGNPRAFQMNVDREYERNLERYTFLKWGQNAFNNFRVVPPGTGKPRIPRPNGLDRSRSKWRRGGLSGYIGGYRQPYHDGQRYGRSGMGCWRD